MPPLVEIKQYTSKHFIDINTHYFSKSLFGIQITVSVTYYHRFAYNYYLHTILMTKNNSLLLPSLLSIAYNYNDYWVLPDYIYYHSWELLYCDTFTPVLFVKVSEHAGTLKHCHPLVFYKLYRHPLVFYKLYRHPFVFYKLLQYRYIKHEILFWYCNNFQKTSEWCSGTRYLVPILLQKVPA